MNLHNQNTMAAIQNMYFQIQTLLPASIPLKDNTGLNEDINFTVFDGLASGENKIDYSMEQRDVYYFHNYNLVLTQVENNLNKIEKLNIEKKFTQLQYGKGAVFQDAAQPDYSKAVIASTQLLEIEKISNVLMQQQELQKQYHLITNLNNSGEAINSTAQKITYNNSHENAYSNVKYMDDNSLMSHIDNNLISEIYNAKTVQRMNEQIYAMTEQNQSVKYNNNLQTSHFQNNAENFLQNNVNSNTNIDELTYINTKQNQKYNDYHQSLNKSYDSKTSLMNYEKQNNHYLNLTEITNRSIQHDYNQSQTQNSFSDNQYKDIYFLENSEISMPTIFENENTVMQNSTARQDKKPAQILISDNQFISNQNADPLELAESIAKAIAEEIAISPSGYY